MVGVAAALSIRSFYYLEYVMYNISKKAWDRRREES